MNYGGSFPYRIGLTGNIATGKSTVAQMLVALGAEYVDADRVAHEVMAPGGAVHDAVVAAFGADVLAPDGTLDRRALGNIVFSDPAALTRLESLVHPATIAEVQRRVDASKAPIVVMEAIKLLESGMAASYDAIWVTTCPPEVQLTRLMQQRGLSRADALRRIQTQSPQAEKIARADVVIHTGGTLEETQAQVVEQVKKMSKWQMKK